MDIERLVTHLGDPLPEDVQVDGDVMQAAVAAGAHPDGKHEEIDISFVEIVLWLRAFRMVKEI